VFCDKCRFYQPERIEFEGRVLYPRMCQAGSGDVCPAEVARQRDLEREEVVNPCPYCGADCDGSSICPACGEYIEEPYAAVIF